MASVQKSFSPFTMLSRNSSIFRRTLRSSSSLTLGSRRICANCKTEFTPSEEMLMELGITPDDVGDQPFYYGRGCDYCNNTGYRGRLGIFEIMVMDDHLRELIMRHASSNLLRQEAIKRGMRTLRESGLAAIFDGQTTIEEVVKETLFDEN